MAVFSHELIDGIELAKKTSRKFRKIRMMFKNERGFDLLSLIYGQSMELRLRQKIQKDMNWNSLKIEVEEYLEADSALDGWIYNVQLHLQVGTENPNERDAAHNALKASLKEEMELRSVEDKEQYSCRSPSCY